MALATKCPHCNTIFRVAHDQLKLRGGIVRCGSCNEVFDGNAALTEPLPVMPVPAAVPTPFSAVAAAPAAPATAATLPESITSLSLDFDDVPALDLPPAGIPAPVPPADPTPQDILSGDTLSEEELQAALEAELAALDARMAAAQPAPEPELLSDAEPEAAAPARNERNERREPTFDPVEPAYALEEDDEQALRQLSAAVPAGAMADVPPLHTLLRAASAPPIDRHTPDVHSVEPLAPAVAPPAVALAVVAPVAPDTTRADELERQHHEETHQEQHHAAAQVAVEEAPVAPADDEPGFVKRARRQQRYGKPALAALALGSLLLVGALAAQALTTFRNPLAAAVPALKPALVAACDALGCKVELPAQIDALAIEQGELQTLSETTFSFTTALRNSSGSAQTWPHIELVLDDANDKTVLRRVFAPRDYLNAGVAPEQGLAPRSEQSVKLYFELHQLKASGYHIAVFYP